MGEMFTYNGEGETFHVGSMVTANHVSLVAFPTAIVDELVDQRAPMVTENTRPDGLYALSLTGAYYAPAVVEDDTTVIGYVPMPAGGRFTLSLPHLAILTRMLDDIVGDLTPERKARYDEWLEKAGALPRVEASDPAEVFQQVTPEDIIQGEQK